MPAPRSTLTSLSRSVEQGHAERPLRGSDIRTLRDPAVVVKTTPGHAAQYRGNLRKMQLNFVWTAPRFCGSHRVSRATSCIRSRMVTAAVPRPEATAVANAIAQKLGIHCRQFCCGSGGISRGAKGCGFPPSTQANTVSRTNLYAVAKEAAAAEMILISQS